MADCPCTSGAPFEECCRPIIAGEQRAETAEALMRSRYSAFATGAIDHLRTSNDPRTRSKVNDADNRTWSESATWHGLEVLSTEGGGPEDTEGLVEFIARYQQQDQDVEHHERATFRKVDGQWFFVDGKLVGHEPYKREQPKVGRNDPCPCGSNKKYKKCCARKTTA